jgi:putative transposase
MPQPLSKVLIHLVFSTKDREPLLVPQYQQDLHGYIGGIAKNMSSHLLHAGSVSDHVHLLLVQPRTCTPADLVQAVKMGSSKWLKTVSSRFRNFYWQNGYGMFSISVRERRDLEAYFDRQAIHHREESFQDEYRRLLHENELEYDERYVWD